MRRKGLDGKFKSVEWKAEDEHLVRTIPSGEQASPQRKVKSLPTEKQEGVVELTRSGKVSMDSNTAGPEATPPGKSSRFLCEFREEKTGSQTDSLKVLGS